MDPYELSSEMKKIVEGFKENGYELVHHKYDTIVQRDQKNNPVNAGMEHIETVMRKGHVTVNLFVYTTRDKGQKRGTFKNISTTPKEAIEDVVSECIVDLF